MIFRCFTRPGIHFPGLCTLALLIHLVLGLWLLDRIFPPLGGPDAKNNPSNASVVLARDGAPLRAFADPRGIWRYPVTPDQVSPLYLQALVAYEDRYFYHHPGINPLAIFRALGQNLKAGTIVSGGSTLTMQTARILSPELNRGRRHRPFLNKGIQVLRALQLEWRYTKGQILALYLTHAPFGGNIQGIWAAAYTYLGKEPDQLSRAEAALLAVLPQAPSFYRPDRHPDRARRARDKVLDRMAAFGIWSPGEVAAAKAEPVTAFRFAPPRIAPLACRRLHRQRPGAALISTTLDLDLQSHVEDLLLDHTAAVDRRQSAAALVVDLTDLSVAVYAGSADFTNALGAGQVDMVRALRSPGSTLKPFVYAMAMDQGLIHSHSLLMDTPRYRAAYMPENFTGGFLGPVSAARALQLSLNVPAVQVLDALGPAPFHDRLKHAGARLRLGGPPNLSLALGGAGTDLESLVTLYTALGRKGLAGRIRLTPDAPIRERHLISPGAAHIVRQILIRSLPGQEGLLPLSGGKPMAWKTGTSYGFRDAWALGLSGNWLAGVWMGRPDGTPSPGQYGAATALPLLHRILDSLPPNGNPPPAPPSVGRQTIAWPSGLAVSRDPGPAFQRHHAWILAGQLPPTRWQSQSLIREIWVDDDGRRATPQCGGIRRKQLALWPEPARAWLPPEWRNNRIIPRVSPACKDIAPLNRAPLTITSIADHSTLTRPPGQDNAPRVPLVAMGGEGQLTWFLNRRPLNAQGEIPTEFPMPQPGAYDLSVMDSAGRCDRVEFKVE